MEAEIAESSTDPTCRNGLGRPSRTRVSAEPAPSVMSGCNDRVVHEQPLRLRAQVSRASGAELGDEEIDAIGAVVRA